METRPGDEWTERLAKLFAEHPAWIAAAQLLSPEATSTVFFRHRPGEPWRLETEVNGGGPRLHDAQAVTAQESTPRR